METVAIKDLRLGNIVRDEQGLSIITRRMLCKGEDDWFFGIELNEEWLLNLGFIRDDLQYTLNKDGFLIVVYFYECWRISYTDKNQNAELAGFWKVHEFQNLIHSLSNTELIV